MTLCPAGPVLRTFVQYLITFCSRLKAASKVISGKFVGPVVLNKCLKFHDPSLNRSRKNSTRSLRRQYLRQFPPYNFRPEVANDVISSAAVDNVSIDVPIKFGDCRSSGFRDIRGGDFVSNERTWRRLEGSPNSAKRQRRFT